MTAISTTTPPVDDRFTTADWGLFLSVAVIWGASFLFIDIGLDALPPGVITLLRVGLGALALAVLPLPRQHTRIRAEDRLRLVTLSVVWVAVPFTLFPIAEQHISSAVAGLLNGGTPIFAAIFAMVLLRQPTRGAQLLGIAVGFIGVVLVSLPSIGEGTNETFGVALVVLATVCYGFAITIAGPMQQRYGSVNLMAKVLALATIWTAPYGLWQVDDATWEIGPVIAVAVLGVVGTGIAFALMGTLVGRVGSTRASFITYLIPVVALALGVAFRDDEVFVLEIVGVVFVIGGALLASRRTASRRQPTTWGCPGSVPSTPMDPDYVETQATSFPSFGEAEPHPSSPAGGVWLWGSLARRAGPAVIRSLLLGGLIVAALALLMEVT